MGIENASIVNEFAKMIPRLNFISKAIQAVGGVIIIYLIFYIINIVINIKKNRLLEKISQDVREIQGSLVKNKKDKIKNDKRK